MLRSRVSALFVFDADHALSGVLSEGDLLRRSELGSEPKRPYWLELLIGSGRLAEAYAHEHGRKAGEVMTRDVETIAEDAELSEAVDRMLRRPHQASAGAAGRNARRRRLALRSPQSAAGPRRLPQTRSIPTRRSGPRSWRSSTSSNGRRERASASRFRTAPSPSQARSSTRRLRGALKVIAENTPGCVAVHDHMAWIEPNSGVVIPSEGDDPKA